MWVGILETVSLNRSYRNFAVERYTWESVLDDAQFLTDWVPSKICSVIVSRAVPVARQVFHRLPLHRLVDHYSLADGGVLLDPRCGAAPHRRG